MGLGQPILVQWPNLECFNLSVGRRFCLLVRLARPFQYQKVNSKQNPKFQRLVGNSEFPLRSVLLTRSRFPCMVEISNQVGSWSTYTQTFFHRLEPLSMQPI